MDGCLLIMCNKSTNIFLNRSHMIKEDDYKFISRIDGATDGKGREIVIRENPNQFGRTFFNLLNQV